MTFIWPWMLFTLLLVPLFVGAYVRLRKRRQQAATGLGPLGLLQDSTGRNPGRRRHIPALFALLGLTFSFFGLARPEMLVDLPRIEGTVILAFDASSSMTADDLEPTRMEAAKAAARGFVEDQPSTVQIGVVAFSSNCVSCQM